MTSINNFLRMCNIFYELVTNTFKRHKNEIIFLQIKDAVNEKNTYNQNFRGLYCTCRRPYPDPEDEIDDEMIQCVVCEDWYHGRVRCQTIK